MQIYTVMKLKIAVVNSLTFGAYTDVFTCLNRLGEVTRLNVPRDIRGSELAAVLAGYHVAVVSTNPRYDREFFEKNSDIVLLARNGIGVDNIDLEAATEHGVIVTRVPGEVEREAVAELAVALMLDAYRMVSQAFIAVRENRWRERTKFIGPELKGKTIGIIGLGNIGKRVAEILSKGFKAKVLAYDPFISPETVKDLDVVLTDFETLLKESDIVSLHTPQTPETRHMMNAKAFELMKPGSMLVNTARGGLVDTDALVNALKTGNIRYVGLDVVEGDYIDSSHPLLQFENVVVTPHIGAYTYESFIGIDMAVAEAIEALARGEKPKNTANPRVFEKTVRTIKH
ncbi:MAG: NAD(P)-dependent oxidoreductase [Candidatus Caldarchaeum sp.]